MDARSRGKGRCTPPPPPPEKEYVGFFSPCVGVENSFGLSPLTKISGAPILSLLE